MNTDLQSIPCPNCKTPIQYDVKLLLTGIQFTCSNCKCSIGIVPDSTPLVEKTLEKFEKLKKPGFDTI